MRFAEHPETSGLLNRLMKPSVEAQAELEVLYQLVAENEYTNPAEVYEVVEEDPPLEVQAKAWSVTIYGLPFCFVLYEARIPQERSSEEGVILFAKSGPAFITPLRNRMGRLLLPARTPNNLLLGSKVMRLLRGACPW